MTSTSHHPHSLIIIWFLFSCVMKTFTLQLDKKVTQKQDDTNTEFRVFHKRRLF